MSEPLLTVDRGEQLYATFTWPGDVVGPAVFAVRSTPTAVPPALLRIASDEASTDGDLSISGGVVTLQVYGPKTLELPAKAAWSLWLKPGEDDASVIAGTLRVYEVVQP